MANDSSMLNIDMVDQFGKNIANVSTQTLEIFSRLGQQLQTVNSVWNDDNYDNFQDNFEHNIMKKIQEVSAEMELFSDYIKKQCEILRKLFKPCILSGCLCKILNTLFIAT